MQGACMGVDINVYGGYNPCVGGCHARHVWGVHAQGMHGGCMHKVHMGGCMCKAHVGGVHTRHMWGVHVQGAHGGACARHAWLVHMQGMHGRVHA